jgi:glycosyltransferase involved in cell wall biosynthesis
LVELIRNLPSGFDPAVVCSGPDGIALELKDLGVPVYLAPQGAWRKWYGRLIALFRQVPKLRGAVRHFGPEIIHANEFHAVPVGLTAVRGEIPLVGHVRLSITPRQIQTYQMQRCTRIVTVSQAVAALFAKSPCADRVRIVHNGVDSSKTPTNPPLPKHPNLRFGLFGLVSERKNQLWAAEALALARAKGANVNLLLAGDAFRGTIPYGEALRERLNQDDLASSCRWLPFQKDVASLYQQIDVNLLISKEEGFGRTIIEAATHQRPSIGTTIGGIPELIEEGRTGWLVREGDTDALADLMIRLSRDREGVLAAGRAAATHTAEHFTNAAHVRKMIGVWEEALAAHRPRM